MKSDHVVITRVKKLSEPVFGIPADALEKITQRKLDAMRERYPEAFQGRQHANNVDLNSKGQ